MRSKIRSAQALPPATRSINQVPTVCRLWVRLGGYASSEGVEPSARQHRMHLTARVLQVLTIFGRTHVLSVCHSNTTF